ncbi:MAG: hypothetical protein WCR72_05345 [Bacteroidota bacterium]
MDLLTGKAEQCPAKMGCKGKNLFLTNNISISPKTIIKQNALDINVNRRLIDKDLLPEMVEQVKDLIFFKQNERTGK